MKVLSIPYRARASRILSLAIGTTVAATATLSSVLLTEGTAHAQPAGASQKREDIALAIGETKTISAVGIDQYTEGQSGIVSINLTDDKTQFVIRAVKPGSTTLLLIRKDKSQVTYLSLIHI